MTDKIQMSQHYVEVLRDVADERAEQVLKHGYTPSNDDGYTRFELVDAAASFAHHEACAKDAVENWPWKQDSFTPTDHRSNLIKACALLVAEIERIDRAAERDPIQNHALPDLDCNGQPDA